MKELSAFRKKKVRRQATEKQQGAAGQAIPTDHCGGWGSCGTSPGSGSFSSPEPDWPVFLLPTLWTAQPTGVQVRTSSNSGN
jgi:hypothetical protein